VQSFKDNQGREWRVEINVAAAKKCRQLAGVDLLKLPEDKFRPLAELLGDVVTFVDVLYCCSAPADGRPATDEEFGRALGGDSIYEAAKAFKAELTGFFPSPAQRKAIAAVFDVMDRTDKKLESRTLKELETLDREGEAERIVAEVLRQAGAPSTERTSPGSSSTSAPDASPSTPTPGPSAS